MTVMSLQSLKSWLEAYGRAWETRDPKAAGELFTPDATYQESPFTEPVRGRPAIIEYWSQATRKQDDIHFKCEIITHQAEIAVAHWSASFIRVKSNTRGELDGVFLLRFGEGNRCESLREWWVGRESKMPPLEDDPAWKMLKEPDNWGVADASEKIDEYL